MHTSTPSRFAGKDPVSAWTHIFGFVASVVGFIYLMQNAVTAPAATAFAIYGTSLVALFLASSTYHFFDLGVRGNRLLRRLDHAAIYVFIAGTYVPVLVHLMDGTARVVALSVVGGVAVLGVLFKLFVFSAPRWVSTSLYVAFGWLALPFAPYLFPQFTATHVAWLVFGSLAYCIGAGVYAFKRPDPWPDVFGFHDIWHVCVLAGAAGHFGLVQSLLSTPPPAF